jgi:hypothetical protein
MTAKHGSDHIKWFGLRNVEMRKVGSEAHLLAQRIWNIKKYDAARSNVKCIRKTPVRNSHVNLHHHRIRRRGIA